MADENKNKIEVLEKLILRSPIVDFAHKNALVVGLAEKSGGELDRLIGVFLKSEEMFFVGLKAAGVDMDEYEAKLKQYFQAKISGVEKGQQTEDLQQAEDLLNGI